MIAKAKHKSGSSGSCLGYILGDMLEKEQRVRIVDYNGFALSHLKIIELEKVPVTIEEKKAHKENVWKISNDLSKIFDARAKLADYRVNNPFEDYIVSCVDDERERLKRIPTAEERKTYGLPELIKGERDDRPLEQIILNEFLGKIGVHGRIEKRLRRMNKESGKRYTVKKTVNRDAMYLAVAHDGTAQPHYHILSVRPDADGKVNDTRNERRRILKAVRDLSKKYKLALKLEGYEVDLEKANEGYATMIQTRDSVLWALKTATSHEELARILDEGMIRVTPSWKKHSETGREYGILFTTVDKKGKKHTWSGSKLDRSLSYSKVEDALLRNQFAHMNHKMEVPEAEEKGSVKTAGQEKANKNKFRSTYNSHYKPLINEVQKSIEDTLAMRDYLHEQIGSCSQELTEKYEQLRDYNEQIKRAEVDMKEALTSKTLTDALALLITYINPVVALIIAIAGRIIAEGDRKAAYETRKDLRAKAENIYRDIQRIKEQQAEYRAEDADMKDALIKDKAARTELFNELNALKKQLNKPVQPSEEEIYEMQIQELERQFPFKHPGHIMYIVHSRMDASIFICQDEAKVFRKMDVGNGIEDRIEAARLMLKDKGYMVFHDQDTDKFYEELLEAQKNENYRIGNMYIQRDGKVIFGEEMIFGNPENTAPALKHEPEPAVNPKYEIVLNYNDGITNFRIKKEEDGTYKLLHQDWDNKSFVNGKATQKKWYIKKKFTSFSEIGRDKNYLYLKIQDFSGKTMYINQYGNNLTDKQLKSLGIKTNGRTM